LEDYLGAMDVSIDERQLSRLDEVSAVVPAAVGSESVSAVTGVKAECLRRGGIPTA
jgi:hypothetical protein